MTHLLTSAESRGSEHWLVRLLRFLQDPDLSRLGSALEKAAVIAAFVVAVVGAFYLARLAVRLAVRARLAGRGRLYHVRLPVELDRARIAQTLAGVAASLHGRGPAGPWLDIELRGEEGRVRALLFSAGVSEARLRHLLGEALPGARLDPAEDALMQSVSRLRLLSLRARSRDHAPLETEFAADPAGLLLRALGDTGPGEAAAVQLLFTTAPRRARSRLLAESTRLRTGTPRRSKLVRVLEAPLALLGGLWSHWDRGPSYQPSAYRPAPQPVWVDRQRVQALYEKAREPLFACSLRLAVGAPTRRRARGLLAELRMGYAQYEGLNGLSRDHEFLAGRRFARRLLPPRPPLLLSASELAALLPLPAKVGEAPVPLERAPARELAPSAAAPRGGIHLGVSAARGRIEPVYVTPRALLQHLHLLGATGAGKTTALRRLAARRDPHARRGNGRRAGADARGSAAESDRSAAAAALPRLGHGRAAGVLADVGALLRGAAPAGARTAGEQAARAPAQAGSA